MKRTIIFSTFLIAVMAVMAQRPQHYGDTIIPETCTEYLFQKPWWGEHWIDKDSLVMIWEAVRDSFYYHNEEDQGWIQIGDSVLHTVNHQLWLMGGGNSAINERLDPFIAPRLVKIVGVATSNILEAAPLSDTILPFPDSTEYLTCYTKDENGSPVCHGIIPWTFGDSCRYMFIETKGMDGYPVCCSSHNRDTTYIPIYEYFFDSPIYVDGEFYMGSTNYSSIGIRWTPDGFVHGNTIADIYTLCGGCGVSDTCPSISTYYLEHQSNSASSNTTPWSHVANDRIVMIFPIYEPCDCPGAMNLRVAGIHGDTARIAWSPSAYVSRWEVSYGQEGAPLSGYTTVWTDTNTFSFILPDSNRYNVRVRAWCGSDSAIYSDWSAMRTVYLTAADTVADSSASIVNVSADRVVMLLPNPADKQVTISAALPLLHVEVYDLAGRMVEARQPSGTTLQLDLKSYPSGTYLVKVTTTNGTTTRKLVVK